MADDPKRPDPTRQCDLLLAAARAFQRTEWQPSVDVYRLHDGWLLKYELAGIRPSDVQLVIRGRVVTVRGVRRDLRIAEVVEQDIVIKNSKVAAYRAKVKLSFKYEGGS